MKHNLFASLFASAAVVFVVIGCVFLWIVVIHPSPTRQFLQELQGVLADPATSPYVKRERSTELIPKYWRRIPAPEFLKVLTTLEGSQVSCHNLSHTVGKLVMRDSSNIADAMSICGDSCRQGCFHGVLFQLFGDQPELQHDPDAVPPNVPAWLGIQGPTNHITVKEIAALLPGVCQKSAEMGHPVEECFHGFGHIFLMALGTPQSALAYCGQSSNAHYRYHCAGGVFMQREATTSTIMPTLAENFAICDYAGKVFSEAFAGCYRYTARLVMRNHPVAFHPQIAAYCDSLTGQSRLGCFHGYGFSISGLIYAGKVKLVDVCSAGTENDQKMCVDGAIWGVLAGVDLSTHTAKRMPTGLHPCWTFPKDSVLEQYCLSTVRDGFYGGRHDFALYSAMDGGNDTEKKN